MPLLNYTTTIQAAKTVVEIQNILAKHGARAILLNYDDAGHIEALTFKVMAPQGELAVRLPIQPDAVLQVLQQHHVPNRYTNQEQAIRIAWRIVKDWVEAQMAILETEMVRMEQIFLPYIVTDSGRTVYEQLLETRFQIPEKST